MARITIELDEDTIELAQNDADKNCRTRKFQLIWIIKEYYDQNLK